MFGTVFNHSFSELIVHVSSNTFGGVFFLSVNFTQDLGLDRAASRECFTHRFGLEPDNRFGQQRTKHTAGIVPGFSPLFVFETQNLQTFYIGFGPLFAGLDVCINQFNQFRCNIA